MAVDIGKAFVQIVPSAQGISGSITKVLGGESTRAGIDAGNNIAGNIVGVLKKVIPAAAIGKLIADSVKSGAALQQSIGGIETLFGAGGLSVEEYAEKVGSSVESVQGEYDSLIASQERMMNFANEAYMTSGLSATEYMDTVTSFAASLKQSTGGDMESLTEIANQAVIDMADNANKMGTDMSSIQNAYQGFAKQNYTMLDNLKLGYGGTKTEMQRLLKDAQKITGIKYDINNLDDVYSAIHVIQEELGITGTTANEAASTISGSFNMLKASFSNVLANLALGQDMAPSLNALVNSASTFLFDNLIPAVVNVVSLLPGSIITVVRDAGPELGVKGLEMLKNLAQGFAEGFPEMATKVGELIGDMLKAIWDNRDQILQIGEDIIRGLIEGFWNMASAVVDALISIVKDAWNGVKNFLGIASPSKKFMYLGEMTGEGFAQGLAGSTDTIRKAMVSMMDPLNSEISMPVLSGTNAANSGRTIVINFDIDNSGKDITDQDVRRWCGLIDEALGGAV